MLGQKKCRVKKNFWSNKNFWAKKMLGKEEDFWVEKFWVQKKSRVQKIRWVQKNFGLKKNVGSKTIKVKNVWLEKKSQKKKFRCKINWVQKNFENRKISLEGESKFWDIVYSPIWRLHNKSRLPAMPKTLQKVFNICPSEKLA